MFVCTDITSMPCLGVPHSDGINYWVMNIRMRYSQLRNELGLQQSISDTMAWGQKQMRAALSVIKFCRDGLRCKHTDTFTHSCMHMCEVSRISACSATVWLRQVWLTLSNHWLCKAAGSMLQHMLECQCGTCRDDKAVEYSRKLEYLKREEELIKEEELEAEALLQPSSPTLQVCCWF